ncbi:MAG: SIMPL domain-containing protein [Ignavibacteriae bacterium]|nr:SIMPL domain-containing protein [Ignavibacteriota bacterium]
MIRKVFISLMVFTAVAFAQQDKEQQRTIRVSGIGKVQVVPDQLHMSIQVNVPRAETAVDALSQNNKLAAQVIAMLKRFGIEDKDIQTARVSVNPVYDYSKQNHPPKIVGYSAQNDVHIVIKKMDDAGKILDQAVQNGATGFGPMSYDTSKRTELERDALCRAADDARVKAELLAKQLGTSLGRVMDISESSISSPPPVRPMFKTFAGAVSESADVPVMSGEVEITANVQVVFELK